MWGSEVQVLPCPPFIAIMDLKDLQQKVLDQAKEKNWGTKPEEVIFAEKLALTHQELSEALDAYRKGKMSGDHGVAEELADTVMRVMHLAGVYDVDLEKEILQKLEANNSRDWSKDQLYIDRDKRAKN